MNSPVALLSTRELMDFLSKVSVVLSLTFSLRELDSPIAKMVYFSGSAFSNFGFCILGIIGVAAGVRGGFMVFSKLCTSSKFVSESCIFDNILKWLQVDNEGVLVTLVFVYGVEECRRQDWDQDQDHRTL